MMLALILPVTIFLILLTAGTFIFLAFELIRLKSPAVNKCFFSYCRLIARDEEVSHLTGASYIFVAALLIFLLFRKEIALVAFGFLAIGDPLATIIGNHVGRVRLLKKTLEGDIACLFFCIVVALVFYYLGFAVLLPVVIVGALVATIAEAIRIPMNDNLTIPIFSAAAMALVEFLITV